MTKRFIEFATQNTDNGEINNGFHDIKTGEWYYTKDSENAKKICELLNELCDEKTEQSKRWIVDDAGTLIDIVTRESFDIVEEIVDTLNYYEETCLKYEKTISELKDGTYVEPLPITSRK